MCTVNQHGWLENLIVNREYISVWLIHFPASRSHVITGVLWLMGKVCFDAFEIAKQRLIHLKIRRYQGVLGRVFLFYVQGLLKSPLGFVYCKVIFYLLPIVNPLLNHHQTTIWEIFPSVLTPLGLAPGIR